MLLRNRDLKPVERKTKNKLVLVVDDHPKVVRFIEIDLKLHGYDVITASSGEQALDLIKSKQPDIMLLDMIMPGVDGLAVLEQVQGSRMPVIAFSASSESRDGAMRLGASDFITKPFHPDDLLLKIESLLAN